MFCFNKKWETLPYSVLVEDKVPCVLNCYKHNGDKNLFMVICCQWKHNFTATRPDQLLKSVTQPFFTKTSESIKGFNHISTFLSNWNIQWHRYLQCHDLRNFWSQIYSLCQIQRHINKKISLVSMLAWSNLGKRTLSLNMLISGIYHLRIASQVQYTIWNIQKVLHFWVLSHAWFCKTK